MADESIIGLTESSADARKREKEQVTETITISFVSDMGPAQMAKKLRQISNLLHAFIANVTRYATISEINAGAGAQPIQQVFTAAANVDSAFRAMDAVSGGNRIQLGPQVPPAPGKMGRA
jgi:hypothetical protein